jgi:uncharacterized protein YodC (DUF2158 family)
MEVGDVVRLKSGGPRMTIASIEVVFARCVWFPDYYGNGDLRELMLRLACLEVEPRDDEAEDDIARRERELEEAGAAGARIVPAETTGLGKSFVGLHGGGVRLSDVVDYVADAAKARAAADAEPGTF